MRRYGVELLAMCSERERRILYIRALRGLEYSKIESEVGVSEANVRQIFHRLKDDCGALMRPEEQKVAAHDRDE